MNRLSLLLLLGLVLGWASVSRGQTKTFTVNDVTFEMVYVFGGEFQMGGTPEQGEDAEADEKPVHAVNVKGFYIGKFEVTQDLWKALMPRNPSFHKGDRLPVEQVNYKDIAEFLNKLNESTGEEFRLPTEAEWEFAARGGNNSQGFKYSGSDDLESVAIYADNSYKKGRKDPAYGTHEVGSLAPNELGLYDMSGNVWECCSDKYARYDSYNLNLSDTDPFMYYGLVNRGGGWAHDDKSCRVSNRNYGKSSRYSDRGFRLVLDAK